MSLRDGLARRFTGGPPFVIKPNELLVETDINGTLIDSLSERVGGVPQRVRRVASKLRDLGFEVEMLKNTGMMIARAERVSEVIQNIQTRRQEFSESVISNLMKVRSSASALTNRTIVGGYSVGELEFNTEVNNTEDEAAIRNALMDLSLKNRLTEAIETIEGVLNVEMRYTRTTFGPRSLRVDVTQLDSILPDRFEEDDRTFLPDIHEVIDVEGAWEYNKGEDAVVAIFDTGFCEDSFNDDRIIDTFHGEGVDSAFSDSETEGHGSMTAITAAGKKANGAAFDGIAPEADLLLARLTDSEGAMAYVEEAMDWFAGKLDEIDKPIISNHSYGVPLCSARTMGLCESTATKVARELSKRDDHQAIYAAGNEADYCGHRLSGVTNGINGINSDGSSIAVGALRSTGSEAQRYSSHGYGTCAPDGDPKPDISAPIPHVLPYGCDTLDMSSGIGGSSGGTSTASPIVAGIAALIASETGTAEKSVIEDALEETATLPRSTQVNIFNDFDARFGNGMVNAKKAVEYVR